MILKWLKFICIYSLECAKYYTATDPEISAKIIDFMSIVLKLAKYK